ISQPESFNGNFMLFGGADARFDLMGTLPMIIELFDNGTARRPSEAGNGIRNYRDKAWYIDDGDLVFDLKNAHDTNHPGRIADDSSLVPFCDPDAQTYPSVEECSLSYQHRLQPLKQAGDRIYVLETEDRYWYADDTHELYGEIATR